MVQNVVKEEVENETVEPAISPVGEAESEVAEALEKIVSESIKASIVFNWAPLGDESQIGHGLNLLGEIIEQIPELVPVRSKSQNIALRFGSKKGKVCARLWFSKTRCVMNTMAVSETGKGGFEPKDQSRQMPENGFPVKTRKKIIAEIRRYIKSRNFSVPAPEAEE